MRDSLSPLCLLPPSIDQGWRGLAPPATFYAIERPGMSPVQLPTPLFWFDPPWHLLTVETADALAASVANTGVTVSALSRDLAAPGGHSAFLNLASTDRESRILPYRPERYGLIADDFDHCSIIDLRLAISRDESGAHVFSQNQIQRWEATTDASPVAGGSWVPATTMPPDVISLDELGSKILQLRKLAPSAAVFVSVGPFRVANEIQRLLRPTDDLQRHPDGIIVRLDQAQLAPLQLAQQTRRIRKCLDSMERKAFPFWLVPGSISADDAARLVALGADAIAVDRWCDVLVQELAEPSEATASSFGYSSRGIVIAGDSAKQRLGSWVESVLAPNVSRFQGLCRSINPNAAERLGSYDPQWAGALGVPLLGI